MTEQDLIEMFPQLAEEGGEWSPETTEAATWYPTFCDDCDTWHNQWLEYGFRRENGVLMVEEWLIDQDGDWDVCEDYPFDQMEERETANYKEARNRALSYSNWVARYGKDPLEEFLVQKTIRHHQKWTWCVSKVRGEDDWGISYYCRHNADGSETLVPSPPSEVRDYIAGCPDSWRGMAKLMRELATSPERDTQSVIHAIGRYFLTDTITVEEPNPNYEAELKAAAKRSLSSRLGN